jgi:hypothetical protein
MLQDDVGMNQVKAFGAERLQVRLTVEHEFAIRDRLVQLPGFGEHRS